MLGLRLLTSVVVIALFAAVLIIDNEYAWLVLMSIVLWFAFSEWAQLAKLDASYAKFFAGFGVFSFLVIENKLGSSDLVLLILAMASFFWLILVPLILKGWLKSFFEDKGTFALIGWFVLTAAALAITHIKLIGLVFLCSVLAITIIADVFAFISGKIFGKNKLAPNVSPGKTWEGVFGALISVLAFNLFIALNERPFFIDLTGTWQFIAYKEWSIVLFVMFSIALVFLAVIGDLFESLLKRNARVKDSGRILPGHGGILDRIDAQLAVLPIAALITWIPLSV